MCELIVANLDAFRAYLLIFAIRTRLDWYYSVYIYIYIARRRTSRRERQWKSKEVRHCARFTVHLETSSYFYICFRPHIINYGSSLHDVHLTASVEVAVVLVCYLRRVWTKDLLRKASNRSKCSGSIKIGWSTPQFTPLPRHSVTNRVSWGISHTKTETDTITGPFPILWLHARRSHSHASVYYLPP